MASKRVRKPPSRQIPCRVMNKSVDNEEHSYVPDTESIPKFDGVSGCKITQKNKCMGDYKYIYPMLDPDGKTRLVTENDFHKRIMHKYRHFEGYDYIYPVLVVDKYEGKRSDLIAAPKVATCFVPEEVERMIPQGVEQILTDYDDRALLYILSRRGDIYRASTRKIPFRDGHVAANTEAPAIKSVSELNEEAEPKPTKKQLKDIERWKKQMEELNRFGSNLSGNRIVHFGCDVNREEWKDDDIMSWFAENYPEDTEDDKTENAECAHNEDFEQCMVDSFEESDECDSGYEDNGNTSRFLSRVSTESETFTSDEPTTFTKAKESLEVLEQTRSGDSKDEFENTNEGVENVSSACTSSTSVLQDSVEIIKEHVETTDDYISEKPEEFSPDISNECFISDNCDNSDENQSTKNENTDSLRNDSESESCEKKNELKNNSKYLSVSLERPRDSRSSESDNFFDAEEMDTPEDNKQFSFETCSDGYSTPDLKEGNLDDILPDDPENVSAVGFPNDLNYCDATSNKIRFMDQLISRTEKDCAISLMNGRNKIQIPLL